MAIEKIVRNGRIVKWITPRTGKSACATEESSRSSPRPTTMGRGVAGEVDMVRRWQAEEESTGQARVSVFPGGAELWRKKSWTRNVRPEKRADLKVGHYKGRKEQRDKPAVT
jgi:hypothetical protein